MSHSRSSSAAGPSVPWWRIKMVWLVLGGPAVVVVAAIVTAVIAYRGADTVIGHEGDKSFADKPAVQGRNHAATPEPAKP